MSSRGWPDALSTGVVSLDLEIEGDGLRVGAMVSGGQPWLFTADHLPQAEHVILRVPLLIGHNIRRFDLPQLSRLTGSSLPEDLDTRLIDTLELASLTFPGEPSQALDKLYREHVHLSDPVEDCLGCVRKLLSTGKNGVWYDAMN